jgi:hypothetical protein
VAPGQGRNSMGGPPSALSSPVLNPCQQSARPGAGISLNAGYDLDNNLTQGHSLRNREIESLVSTLRATADGHALDTVKLYHAEIGTPIVDQIVNTAGNPIRISRLTVAELK